jgi:hypothetical protein
MRRRHPHLIQMPSADQRQLENLLRDGRTEQRIARRARILLAMTDPQTRVDVLVEQVALTRFAIWDLCRRYETRGVDSVFDAPRSAGRPWEISPLAKGRD